MGYLKDTNAGEWRDREERVTRVAMHLRATLGGNPRVAEPSHHNLFIPGEPIGAVPPL